MRDLAGTTRIYAVIDPLHLDIDLNKEDNTKSVQIAIEKLDYILSTEEVIKFISPSQRIVIPVQIFGTGLGDMKYIPVELLLDNKPISKTYVNIGEYNSVVDLDVKGTIPSSTSIGTHTLQIIVNREFMDKEVSSTNNVWGTAGNVKCQKPDLSLKFNTTVVTDGDIYSYPSANKAYTFPISAVDKNETIKEITTLGKTTNPNKNSQDVTLNLDKNQKQEFHVIVESACKGYEKEYNITVVRLNDNIEVDIWADVGGTKYPAVMDSMGNYIIPVPVSTTDNVVNIKMKDPDAKVVQVDAEVIDKNLFTKASVLTPNTNLVYGVTISAQDTTLRKTFTVTLTNSNQKPTLKITNKAEIKGAIYGLGGVLKGSKFIPYGNEITAIELAKRMGRTNGLIVELEVKDMNPEQYLRGHVELNGVKYLVRWNTFDGPKAMKSGDIKNGYIYVDRTSLHKDMPLENYNVTVSDYQSESEAELPISSVSDVLNFGVDITAPTISATADAASKRIAVSAVDTMTGMQDIRYRTSLDRGTTFDDYKAISGGSISIVDSGIVYVEVTARDKINNTEVKLVVTDVGGSKVTVGEGNQAWYTTTRVADFVFINIRKQNSDQLNKEDLETFK